MLDELQALGLLGLIVCQYLLIRGCFQIKEGINENGGSISEKIQASTDLIDEVAQLISDFSDNIAPPAVAQPPSGIGEMVAMFLNKQMNPAPSHGPQNEEWEIFENDPNPPTLQTED